jgi:hypothetical protein
MDYKNRLSEALSGLLKSNLSGIGLKTVKRFKDDFFDSEEPLTELLLKIDELTFIRMDNLDFADKDYMFVN